jgi:hypothetical protein
VHLIRNSIFPIYAIGLIILLCLSTAHKGLHDFVFHWDTSLSLSTHSTESHCVGHASSSQNSCSHHSAQEDGSDSDGCDSLLCPVSIFAQGLEIFDASSDVPPILIVIVQDRLLKAEKPDYSSPNSPYFVRGPPSISLKA